MFTTKLLTSPFRKFVLVLFLSTATFLFSFPVKTWLGFGLVDDAYISMRYARNWAENIGPFFNPGERVEGYTNFLWTFFLYIGARLGADPPVVASLLGAICLGLTVPAVFFLAERLCAGWLACFFATLLLVSDAGWWAWSLSGMETSLLAFLFTCGCAVWGMQSRSVLGCLALSTIAILAALTRPEGGAFFLWVLATTASPLVRERFARSRSIQQGSKRYIYANLAILIGMFTAVYLPYLLWRRSTYGLWLPNSFYAKHDFAGMALVKRGAVYVWRVIAAHPLWWAVPLGLAAGGWRDKRFLGLFIFAMFFLAVVVLSGGDHFTLGRFCVPLVGVFSVLTADAFRRACDRVSSLRRLTVSRALGVVYVPLTLLLVLGLGAMNASWTYWYRNGGLFHRSEVMWAEAWGWMGEIWREKTDPGTVVAVTTAGALPYVSSLPTIDILGINDHHISQRDMPVGGGVAGHEKGDAAYVMRRRPQLVQIAPMLLFQRTPYPEEKIQELFSYPAQWEMAADPIFRACYIYVTYRTRFGYISYHEYRQPGKTE